MLVKWDFKSSQTQSRFIEVKNPKPETNVDDVEDPKTDLRIPIEALQIGVDFPSKCELSKNRRRLDNISMFVTLVPTKNSENNVKKQFSARTKIVINEL